MNKWIYFVVKSYKITESSDLTIIFPKGAGNTFKISRTLSALNKLEISLIFYYFSKSMVFTYPSGFNKAILSFPMKIEDKE